MVSSGKFAKDVLEQSLPNRKSVRSASTNHRIDLIPPVRNIQQNLSNTSSFENINESAENINEEYKSAGNINRYAHSNLLTVNQNYMPVSSKSTNNLNYLGQRELDEHYFTKTVHLSLNNLSQPQNEDAEIENLIELSGSTSLNVTSSSDQLHNLPIENNVVNQRTCNNTRDFHATKSTIFEFDPFATENVLDQSEPKTNEKLLMEAFLQNYYGDSTIKMDDDVSVTSDNDFTIENSDLSPPSPPERNDSLTNTPNEFLLSYNRKSESSSQWFYDNDNLDVPHVHENNLPKPKRTTGITKQFSKLLKSVPESALQLRPSLRPKSGMFSRKVEKPPLSKLLITHDGYMMRSLTAPIEELFKHFQDRYCFLSNQTLFCYADNNNQTVKEKYNLDSLYSIQVIKKLTLVLTRFLYSVNIIAYNM